MFLREGSVEVDYKALIIELIQRSDNNELLELIYRFAKKLLD